MSGASFMERAQIFHSQKLFCYDSASHAQSPAHTFKPMSFCYCFANWKCAATAVALRKFCHPVVYVQLSNELSVNVLVPIWHKQLHDISHEWLP